MQKKVKHSIIRTSAQSISFLDCFVKATIRPGERCSGFAEPRLWAYCSGVSATMNVVLTLAILIFAQTVMAQVFCVQAIGHTPRHERIFFSKADPMASERVINDLGPVPLFPEMTRIDALFANPLGERTNYMYKSCLPEVHLTGSWLQCQGGLLSQSDVFSLLSGTFAAPRSIWTNHASHVGGRYVFSLIGAGNDRYVIDLRSSSTAIVFFPDGTYRCIMPSSSCATPFPDMFKDLTAGQPSTCEVHCVGMTTKLVELDYGLKRSAEHRELLTARRTLFPHADEPYDTGLCIPPREKHARVYVCAECSLARAKSLSLSRPLRVTR